MGYLWKSASGNCSSEFCQSLFDLLLLLLLLPVLTLTQMLAARWHRLQLVKMTKVPMSRRTSTTPRIASEYLSDSSWTNRRLT